MKLLGITAATRELRWPLGSPYRLRLRIADANGAYQPLDGRDFALSVYRSAVILSVAGTIGSDDTGAFCEFYFDGAANAAIADAASPIWEIAELFADGKALLLTGPVYVAEAAPITVDGDTSSSAFDAVSWSPERDAVIVTETGARGAAGRDAPTGEHSATPVNAGFYPRAAHPIARTHAAVVGHNDLYTVPAGRKALFFDAWITNLTAVPIGWYPELRIGDTYYRLGSIAAENPAGIGHNYSSSGIRTIPILLNAGETFGINSDTSNAVFWAHIIEFDATSPLARADIGTGTSPWVAGDNIFPITIPPGATIGFGVPGYGTSNNPGYNITGIALINGSASFITYTGPYMVPAGGTKSSVPGGANQFGGTNTLISNGGAFFKYFPGGLAPGDSIVINSSSAAAGQLAWTNYWLF